MTAWLCRPFTGAAWLGGLWSAHLRARAEADMKHQRAIDDYLAGAKYYQPLPKRKS